MERSAELLGRGQELAELVSCLEQARAGRGQLVFVVGEPGVGKTTLVEAAASVAAEAGARAVWSRCWEAGGASPFWPWMQVLRGSTVDADAETLSRQLGPGAADVVHLVPELAPRLPGVVGAPVSDSPGARLRLFDAVASYLHRAAEESDGLLVVLEDLHAADEGSLQLLRVLARTVATTKLVVLGTYRERDVSTSPQLRALLDPVARRARVLRLSGLDEAAVGALLAHAGVTASEDLVHRVHQTTDGNPFLVHQAARLLRSERPRGEVIRLPADAQSLISRRLDDVPEGVRQTLRLAAILGRDFDIAPLIRLTSRPGSDLLDQLGLAEGAAIVNEHALGRWSFAHAILRDALATELAPVDRAAAHRRAAEALAAMPSHEGDPVTLVAHHLFEAGDAAAVDACAHAATASTSRLAYEEAVRWYERALTALSRCSEMSERRRYELLVSLAKATLQAGRSAEAREVYFRAFQSARALGSVELLAEAAIAIGYAFPADPTIISALDDALVELPEADTPLRAKVLITFARVLMPSSVELTVIRDIGRQARDIGRRLGDRETLWQVLSQWHLVSILDFEADHERLALGDELLALSEASGDRERVMHARAMRAMGRYLAGELRDAEAEIARAVQDAEELRLPFHQWVTKMYAVPVALARGRIEDAERLADAAHAAGALGDFPAADPCFDAQLLAIRRHQGRFDDVATLARRAIERWGTGPLECVRDLAIVRAKVETGRPDEARALFDGLLTRGGEPLLARLRTPLTQRASTAPCCRAALAELSWALHDTRLAELLYASLLPYPRRHIFEMQMDSGASLGVGARFLGQLAALLGRYEEAEAHFEAAQQLHERMGALVASAHGAVDHARMLLLRQRPGDRDRAVEKLRSATQAFRSIGMDYYAERAAELLAPLVIPVERARFRREGEHWRLEFRGRVAHVRHSKGVEYLAELLAHPGREFHATELADQGLDADPERARQRVSRAVKDAVDRLERADSELGQHLRSRVRTGLWSCYLPDPRAPVSWGP